MILWTLRHTTPQVPPGVCYGRTDVDVASTFDNEHPLSVQALHSCHVDRIFCSPLLRCKRLAEQASQEYHWPIEIAPELSEIHFGEWESKQFSDIPAQELQAWKQNLRHFRFPSGESFADVGVRVLAYLHKIFVPKSEILWITHAGVISSLLHSIGGVPDADFIEGRLGYGTLIRFDLPDNLLSSSDPVPWKILYKGVTQMPFG